MATNLHVGYFNRYDASMFNQPLGLDKPGLFVTATDTGVGKTVITCAIAWALRQQGHRVGVCKPMASGCRQEREGLVSDDVLALAHFADCRLPLGVICPICFAAPLAPAVAAQETDRPPDYGLLARSLERLDTDHDVLLIEGIGGLLVPLDEKHTVLDLIKVLGYPVVVVARAGLGTLSHTAMTVTLLRQAGCEVAGLVVNGYEPDAAHHHEDPSIATNRQWLAKMNHTAVLATVPMCLADQVDPAQGQIPEAILETVGRVDWLDQLGAPRLAVSGR